MATKTKSRRSVHDELLTGRDGIDGIPVHIIYNPPATTAIMTFTNYWELEEIGGYRYLVENGIPIEAFHKIIGKDVMKCVAKCDPRDVYDPEYGKMLALGRLKVKYWSYVEQTLATINERLLKRFDMISDKLTEISEKHLMHPMEDDIVPFSDIEDDINLCDSCIAMGSDYYFDEEGELTDSCSDCPLNPHRIEEKHTKRKEKSNA